MSTCIKFVLVLFFLILYLPGCGLPSEELMIEGAVRGIELGLKKNAAIGYCLQWGGAFVRKAKSNEELTKKKTNTVQCSHPAAHIQVNT